MPEIKKIFFPGTMEKDYDVRLVKNGQHIDSLNIQVSKADGSNVGLVRNIKGNSIAHNSISGLSSNHEVIGSIFDEKNNRIFWFVVDDSEDSHIFMWNVGESNVTDIVSGTFLKFNKNYKITGVNILEDFLLWTDGLNQPRKINIPRAIADNGYYDSELKISVAKYAPWRAPIVWDAIDDPSIKSRKMEEEFIRFAYRYKFVDNEVSLISPFTPIVFKMEDDTIDTTSTYYSTSDLKEIGSSTTIKNMVNSINCVELRIPLPSSVDGADIGAKEDFQIEKIDILYKESDSNAIRVVDTIDVSSGNTSGYQTYVYKSTNFRSTLPEDQLTRVFDNVPYTALAQEVAGNRVVYGNIKLKNDLPEIDFAVVNSAKRTDSDATIHQSVKQRRTYEVGIVLSDIFGRTSPVITSDNSIIYVGAKGSSFDHESFLGDSLKIYFLSISDPNNTLYSSTNITGWYSYKIVVKQKEQEYYNAYVPGIFNYGNFKSYFVIHGDNINKIPRSTDSSDAQSNFSSSSVRVYPKVINTASGYGSTFENSYRTSSFGILDIVDIGKLSDYNFTSTSKIYESSKDHLIGKLPTLTGTVYSSMSSGGDFAVLETEPFESSLDIYYETPTSGKISDIDLNSFSLASNGLISFSRTSTVTSVNISEGLRAGDKVSNIYVKDSDMIPISGTLFVMSIGSQTFSDRLEIKFDEEEGEWALYLKTGFRIFNNASGSFSIIYKLLWNATPNTYTGLSTTFTNVNPTVYSDSTSLTFSTSKPDDSSSASLTLGKVTPSSLVMKLNGTNGSGTKTLKYDGIGISAEIRDVSIGEVNFENVSTYDTTVQNQSYPVTDFIEIINNKDTGDILIDANGNEYYELVDANGTYIVNYHASQGTLFTSNFVSEGHQFELRFRTSEYVNTFSEYHYVSINVIGVAPSVLGAEGSNDPIYWAPGTSEGGGFDYSWQACAEGAGSDKWTPVQLYYSGDDPFVVPEGANVPGPMYEDSALSVHAKSGWYMRLNPHIVGYYFYNSNVSLEFQNNGWWQSPVYCSGLTQDESESSSSLDNPKDVIVYDGDTTDDEAPTDAIP